MIGKTINILVILFVFFPYSQHHAFASDGQGKEAMWWNKYGQDAVRCELCPFRCILNPSQTGQCRVRRNTHGTLETLNYGKVVAAHVDPMEKKPVFHVLPGAKVFSIATAGCNLHCKYCQNWSISQRSPAQVDYVYMEPQDIVNAAKKYNCSAIAYTYTEPIIFYELVYETAKLARENGLINVMVTAGFINEKPLRKLCEVMDAIKVDFKAYDQDFYREIVFGDLSVVLQTLKIIKQEGVWLELVNLVVPTLNDDPAKIKELCEWINTHLGSQVPIHFSRFHPMYRLTNLPPTPVKTLETAASIARDAGLQFVYIGNVPLHSSENTYCPQCGKTVIKRVGYQVTEMSVNNGQCSFCKHDIPGIWEK